MPSNIANFAHKPLSTSKPTIRVLRLGASTKKDEIRCTLKHIDLEEDVYVCLSYIWGEPQPTQTIFINDQPFEVRRSLWMFLRRAQKHKIQDWLWIDAICIDQENIPERNQQVRLMGDVYSKAKHVLVYPGEVPWYMELVALLVRVFKTKSENYVNSESEYLYFFMNVLLFCLSGRFPYWKYWTRMWVVQEVILAKTAFLMLRNTLLDLQHFHFAIAIPGHAWKLMELRQSWREDLSKPSLAELISKTSGFGCQNQNDRIYALLGLLPKELSDQIVIDYDREWSLVVLDALQMVRSGKLSLTTEADLLNVFEGIKDALLVWCGECAKSPVHALKLPDGRVVEPISELVNEDQDFFLLAGPSYVIPSCPRSQIPREELGWRPIEPLFCSCCAHEVLPDYSLDLTLSRPLENVICGRVRESERGAMTSPDNRKIPFNLTAGILRAHGITTVTEEQMAQH